MRFEVRNVIGSKPLPAGLCDSANYTPFGPVWLRDLTWQSLLVSDACYLLPKVLTQSILQLTSPSTKGRS